MVDLEPESRQSDLEVVFQSVFIVFIYLWDMVNSLDSSLFVHKVQYFSFKDTFTKR